MTKTGALKYISHLDFLKLMIKAVKKAKIDVAYSLGFNPSPKLSLGIALPLFIERQRISCYIQKWMHTCKSSMVHARIAQQSERF